MQKLQHTIGQSCEGSYIIDYNASVALTGTLSMVRLESRKLQL